MKKCPKCGSVTDSEYECKICGESICYEPYADSNREHIAKGYRFRYWMPKLWLPIAAGIGCGGYMEYYVQRRGNEAAFAYSVMSGCLIGVILLTLLIRSLAVKKEQKQNIL